jgi:cytoskeletal protein CcmA (bactofilin family)
MNRLFRLFLFLAAIAFLPAAARADFALRLPEGTNGLALADSYPGALLAVSGSDLSLSGAVQRDFFALSQAFRIAPEAAVQGDARFLSREAVLSGTVSGDAIGGARTVRLAPDGKIAGDVFLSGDSLLLEGAVEGECLLFAREVVLSGTFGSDVRVQAEKLRVAPGTRIAGALSYAGCPRPVLDDTVVVAGGLREAPLFPALSPGRGSVSVADLLLSALQAWVASLLVGVFFLRLFPGFLLAAIFEIGARPFRTALAGLATAFCAPFLAVAFLLAGAGRPLGLILLAFSGIGAYLGHVVAAFWAALAVLRAQGAARVRAFWAMAAGLLVWHLLSLLPPVSGVLAVLGLVFGLGALVRTLFARRLPPPVQGVRFKES